LNRQHLEVAGLLMFLLTTAVFSYLRLRITFAVISTVLLALGVCLAQDNPQPKPDAANSTQTSPTVSPSAGGNPANPGTGRQNQEAARQKVPEAPSRTKTEQEKEIERREQSYRVLGVVPRFATTHLHAPPMTGGEKFHLFVTSAFDPVTFVLIGAQAGVSQAQDSFPSYGQGAEGYGKRYGAAFADSVSATFFSNYFYPVVFKQDPRYFRVGPGHSFKRRFVHSLTDQLVTHQDSGRRNFPFSNVGGALTSGGISNIYYPPPDRGFGLTMSRAGIALLYGELGGIFNEFWPDVQNRIQKNKRLPTLPSDEPPASPNPAAAPPQ
jgi:hypothetical protein